MCAVHECTPHVGHVYPGQIKVVTASKGWLLCFSRAEEEQQRRLQLERKAQEAEEERLLQEARAAREAKRRALDKLARRFAVKLEGSADIDKPPQVQLQTPCPGRAPAGSHGRPPALST